MKTLTSAVLIAVGSTVLSFPSLAHACTAIACDPSRLALPPEGALIPANALAIAGQGRLATHLVRLELQSDDVAVPPVATVTSNGATFLNLGSSLLSGASYRLVAQGHCDGPNAPADIQREVLFRAGPIVALPTASGTASVSYAMATVVGNNPILGDAGAAEGPKAVVAHLAIEASGPLEEYLPVTRFRTFVDGQLWAESEYGHGVGSYEKSLDLVTTKDFTRLHASCGRELSSSLCEPPGLELGAHTVEIRAHVAGMTRELPGIQLNVDLQCLDGGVSVPEGGPIPTHPDAHTTAPDAPTDPDASTTDPDANDPTPVPDDAGAGATDGGTQGDAAKPNPSDPTPDSDAGGCSVSSGRAAKPSWSLLGLTSAVLLSLRRRRVRG